MSGAPFGACSGFRAGRIMKQSERLMSLDALRGFDMLFIMGFAGLVTALCKLCPGEFSDWMTAQMGHADWNGFFHHDTIFPLFLFIAGISFPFSLAKQREKGMSERSIYLKVIRRGLTLVALGFVYSGLFKLDFATLRLPSVLGRIGLAWMFAALLFGLFRSLSNVYTGFDFLAQLNLPSTFYNMLPYIISLLVLALTSSKSRAPKAEGIPYDKGSR